MKRCRVVKQEKDKIASNPLYKGLAHPALLFEELKDFFNSKNSKEGTTLWRVIQAS
jgi:hypothetical protein